MKCLIDSSEFDSTKFRVFGAHPDNDPAILQLDDAFIEYVILKNRENVCLLSVASGIWVMRINIKIAGRPHELIVTFSESETELIRHSLLVVPMFVSLAA
jgi:hypothetical protein